MRGSPVVQDVTKTKRILVDEYGRMLVTTDITAVGESVSPSYDYTHDANGNLTQVDKQVGTEAWRRTMTYDANGLQLTMSSWSQQ